MAVRRRWPRFRKLERHELGWLIAGLTVCLLLWGFLALASQVMEGDTTALDTKILMSLRKADDPSRPIGPAWIETALLDLTAIGGPTVLGLVVFSVVGFLALQGRYRTALVVLITAASGEVANVAMKNIFLRPRPTVVPHRRDVASTSFPSGHAMESAIIYLTLGAMLMRLAERRVTKLYCIGMAIFVTFLVGVSRVYLGVHYPTDVIGGWIFGFLWASLCWLVSQRFEEQTGVAEEREKLRKCVKRQEFSSSCFARMSTEDLSAIYEFLHTLPSADGPAGDPAVRKTRHSKLSCGRAIRSFVSP